MKTKPHVVQAGLKLTMYLRLTVLILLAFTSQVPRLQTGLPCWGLSLGLCMPRKHFTDRATFLVVNYVFVRKCQPLGFLENYIYLLCACMWGRAHARWCPCGGQKAFMVVREPVGVGLHLLSCRTGDQLGTSTLTYCPSSLPELSLPLVSF